MIYVYVCKYMEVVEFRRTKGNFDHPKFLKQKTHRLSYPKEEYAKLQLRGFDSLSFF